MENKSGKSKVSALLLAFFLGGFGAHRFYTGNKGSAVLMLLLSLSILGLPIVLFWSWIDILTILFDKFRDGEGELLLIW